MGRRSNAAKARLAAESAKAPEPHIEPVTPVLESGLGDLSEADKAAIRGDTPLAGYKFETEQKYELTSAKYEAVAVPPRSPGGGPAAGDMTHEDYPLRYDVEIDELARRLATLEHQFESFKAAVEAGFKSAASQRLAQVVQPSEHKPIIASAIEQEAYTRENFRRFKANDPTQPQFDGIEAWRTAGRPGVA